VTAERENPPAAKLVDPLPADERRRRYFEDYRDLIDRHREGSFFYEQRAIEFATSAMKVLTYLNGGGLVAIPAVVALFKTNPADVKTQLIYAAAAFIGGLVCVALSQAFAFFAMARRSEASIFYGFEEMEILASVHYPTTAEDHKGRMDRAQQNRNIALTRTKRSDVWRLLALVCVWLSLFLFVGRLLPRRHCSPSSKVAAPGKRLPAAVRGHQDRAGSPLAHQDDCWRSAARP